MNIRILNTLLSCPLIKRGRTTEKEVRRALRTWRSMCDSKVLRAGWGGCHKLQEVKVQKSMLLPTSQLFISGASGAVLVYVLEKVQCLIWRSLLHFYAPSLLDIHIWAHKLPNTKKLHAVNRSLHCGWQCRTNASPWAENKFLEYQQGSQWEETYYLEVTPKTLAASSWILLLLDTFTTKCHMF